MADEVIDDKAGNEGESDPLVDGADATSTGGDEQSTAEGGTEEVTPNAQDGSQATGAIEGTPFKDQAALVEGYKNIQRLVATRDNEVANLKKQLNVAISAIQQAFGTKQKGEQNELPKGEEFWKALSQDPVGLIKRIAALQTEELQSKYEERIAQLEGKTGGFETNERVNSFLLNHPDFTSEEEDAMVEILEANPMLKQLPNGLDLVYDSVVANKYRSTQSKSATQDAVAGAKQVAGLGGKKTSIPTTPKQKDPFDEVLELDKGERELFRMGRK
jgi:hypothetical protein